MLFKVKIPAESFTAFLACKWLLVIVRVHVKCKIVHLMEGLATDVTLEWFFAGVCESVIFVVAFLVESFAANIADERLVSGVNSDVSIQGG